jgi:hypothetical protein
MVGNCAKFFLLFYYPLVDVSPLARWFVNEGSGITLHTALVFKIPLNWTLPSREGALVDTPLAKLDLL